MEFIFQSPTVKIQEKDIPIPRNITLGFTSVGIVGEFPKGPAFEPVLVSNKADFFKMFGNINSERLGDKYKFLGSMYGDSFLSEGNQLYVTRVLGRSGYNAGDAWLISMPYRGINNVTMSDTFILTNTTLLLNDANYIYNIEQSSINIENPAGNPIVIGNLSFPLGFSVGTSWENVPPASAMTLNGTVYTGTGNRFTIQTVSNIVKGTAAFTARTNTRVQDRIITNISNLSTERPDNQSVFIIESGGTLTILEVSNDAVPTGTTSYTMSNAFLDISQSPALIYPSGATGTVSGFTGIIQTSPYPTNPSTGYLITPISSITKYGYTFNNVIALGAWKESKFVNIDFIDELEQDIVTISNAGFKYNEDTDELFLPNVLPGTNPNVTLYNVTSITSTVAQTALDYNVLSSYTVGMSKTEYYVDGFSTTATTHKEGKLDYFVLNYEADAIFEQGEIAIGILRSNGVYSEPNKQIFYVDDVTLNVSSMQNPTDDFTISVTSQFGNEEYICSLDRSKQSYIENVLGIGRKSDSKKMFVECFYGDMVAKLISDGLLFGVPILSRISNTTFSNYKGEFDTPASPFVVSQLKGNSLTRLFQFVSISDGDAANREIKISILNLDFQRYTFDIYIRDFNDTDDNPVILESFTQCSMNPQSQNYVLRRIGGYFTNDISNLVYELRSSYVYLYVNEDADILDMPCGFEGYVIRNYAQTATGLNRDILPPAILYKKSYSDTDVISKTYLGISEKGYGSTKGGALNQNIFNYFGSETGAGTVIKTKGFHLDSGATFTFTNGSEFIGEFEVGSGALRSFADTLQGVYSSRESRKFTLCVAGGYDGWDIYRDERTNTDLFKEGNIYHFTEADYYAYKDAYYIFDDSEKLPINLMMTPGIDWSNNNELVKEVIALAESPLRQDFLYIVDAPDVPRTSQMYEDIADRLDVANISTSYAATYFPYVRVNKTSDGRNAFIPPTGDVIRNMARTDKLAAQWIASAGDTYGLLQNVNGLKAFGYVNENARDILYNANINPIAMFNGQPPTIFGNKTLLRNPDSLLDSVNIRRLVLFAKNIIKRIARQFLFTPNDQTLVDEFLRSVNPVLQNIQNQRGIRRFVVEYSSQNTPETLDRKQLYFVIRIVPTTATEFIGITFEVTPNSITFNE